MLPTKPRWLTTLLFSALLMGPLKASVTLNIVEFSDRVEITLVDGGSFNLTALGEVHNSNSSGSAVWAINGWLMTGPIATTPHDFYTDVTVPDGASSFGSGTSWVGATSHSGAANRVGINANGVLFVPRDYVSETVFQTGVSTYSTPGANSLSGLGITAEPASYTYSWGSGDTYDFLQVNISAVPEPSTFAALLSCCLFGFTLIRRRPRTALLAS